MSCDSPSVISEIPYFPGHHDPNAGRQGPWRFLISCPAGVSIVDPEVVAVTEDDYPLPLDPTGEDGDTFVIEFDRFELATDVTEPNTFAVYFFTLKGQQNKAYKLRCRGTKDTTPTTGFDVSMLLLSRNG